MSGIELIFDEAVYDGTFPDCLVSDEHDFKLDCVLFMGSQTQVFFELRTHLLKSNYYQAVSIIFSIFRTMDLYQFTKYESISERIKRLASPSSLPSPPLPLQTTIKMRPFQSPPPTIPQKFQD